MKRGGQYNYTIDYIYKSTEEKGYKYQIFNLDTPPLLIIESEEWFDSRGESELAALGHISLLEKGQEND
ncbi:MAG TPA: hypothetical protein VNU45_09200 [Rummeliibacillus sp.]|nr:hypothetical protein [Rummeliibacillus sp.]